MESALRLERRGLAVDALPAVVIAGALGAERSAMEHFVASEFLQHYGANVTVFMPWLLGLSQGAELMGVAGLRPAGSEALFVEHYLDSPIELEIAQHSGVPTLREKVLEIGNLAGQVPGVTRALFPLLTELIYKRGYVWSVCNTTSAVRNTLSRLDIPFLPLVRALPERLGASRFAWGSYYAQETVVIAISLAAAHEALLCQPALAAVCERALADIYEDLPKAN